MTMPDTFSLHTKDAGASRPLMQEISGRLDSYIDHLRATAKAADYEEEECSINLPFDDNIVRGVNAVIEDVVTDDLKYIVVVGIGGSNLGAWAVYEAVRGTLSDPNDNRPQILFADTPDPERLSTIASTIRGLDHPEEFLINVVTKSGSTTETISNVEYLLSALQKTFDAPEKRIVGTTDQGSKLWKAGNSLGFPCLEIPARVGGRFSVFSAVGQFPLGAAGIRVDELLEGARGMRDRCLTNDVDENPALATAALLYLYYQRGIDIYNTFFFNPQLESVGKWFRQLLGESIGKQYNRQHQQVRTGITPLVSIGSTDLHSMAQLYFGGPHDKFTTLVYAPTNKREVRIPDDPLLGKTVEGIYGKDARSIMTAIYEGVRETYRNEGLPFTEIRLTDLSPASVGSFLQYQMMSVMMLADLLDINAFDQPNVEGYKEETRKRL